jgi:hypothetical protein
LALNCLLDEVDTRRGAIGCQQERGRTQTMTTSTAQLRSRSRATGTVSPLAGVQRFGRSLAAMGAIVLDAIEATRAIESAHDTADRRQVLDRFTAATTRHAA